MIATFTGEWKNWITGPQENYFENWKSYFSSTVFSTIWPKKIISITIFGIDTWEIRKWTYFLSEAYRWISFEKGHTARFRNKILRKGTIYIRCLLPKVWTFPVLLGTYSLLKVIGIFTIWRHIPLFSSRLGKSIFF